MHMRDLLSSIFMLVGAFLATNLLAASMQDMAGQKHAGSDYHPPTIASMR